MTQKQTAEAYVREHRPALMELTKGCEIKLKRDKWTKCFIAEEATPGVPAVVHLYGAPSVYLTELDGKNLKIIGHPINLQDWLAVLGELEEGDPFCVDCWGNLEDINRLGERLMHFNLTTGQPATEADYKAFNAIVNI